MFCRNSTTLVIRSILRSFSAVRYKQRDRNREFLRASAIVSTVGGAKRLWTTHLIGQMEAVNCAGQPHHSRLAVESHTWKCTTFGVFQMAAPTTRDS